MKNNIPKLYLGPMSKNIVDAAIDIANKFKVHLGFCASRRQIEFNGGYVNNWTTEAFVNYVRDRSSYITLIRDHGGPAQGLYYDDGMTSFRTDVGLFNIIHIDPWKTVNTFNEGIIKTAQYITACNKLNNNCFYEVGTEQSIYPYSAEELDIILKHLKLLLGSNLFNKIVYVVIQSGTSLKGTVNTGKYDANKLKDMINVCKSFSILSKEHNGDYLDSALIQEKGALGLNAINIAPEFGVLETTCILDRMKDSSLLDEYFNLCLESGKWKKWVDNTFNPFEDKCKLIEICGHYLFSDNIFKKMLNNEIFFGLEEEVKNKVEIRIKDILGL